MYYLIYLDLIIVLSFKKPLQIHTKKFKNSMRILWPLMIKSWPIVRWRQDITFPCVFRPMETFRLRLKKRKPVRQRKHNSGRHC